MIGILMITSTFIFKIDNEIIRKIEVGDIPNLNNEYKYYIDEITNSEDKLNIAGWCVVVGKGTRWVNNKFILIDDDKVGYVLNTVMQQRPSVTEFINDGINYDNSGLVGNGNIKNLPEGKYNVGILLENELEQLSIIMTDQEFIR